MGVLQHGQTVARSRQRMRNDIADENHVGLGAIMDIATTGAEVSTTRHWRRRKMGPCLPQIR